MLYSQNNSTTVTRRAIKGIFSMLISVSVLTSRNISNLETLSISATGTTTYKLMTVVISGTDYVLIQS